MDFKAVEGVITGSSIIKKLGSVKNDRKKS